MEHVTTTFILEEEERYFIKKPVRSYSLSGNWIDNSYEIIIKGELVYYYNNGRFSGLIKSLDESHISRNESGQILITSSLFISKVASYFRAHYILDNNTIIFSKPYPKYELALADCRLQSSPIHGCQIYVEQWYWYEGISKTFSSRTPDRVYKWNTIKNTLEELKELSQAPQVVELAQMA